MSDKNFSRQTQAIASFWAARNARERTQISLMVVAIVLGLIYALFIGPALSGRPQLAKNLPVLRQQAVELQMLAREAVALANVSAAPFSQVSKENINATLERRGLKVQNLAVSDGMVKLQLSSISYSGLLDWLDEMQKTAHLSVVDANITALTQTDIVDAALTLRQQKNELKGE